jgi:TrmH family RNA methyltransferase
MPTREPLTSLDNPRVKAVVRLREHRERRKTGLFVAEGTREISRALGAGLRAREVFVFWGDAKPQAAGEVAALVEQASLRAVAVTGVTEPLLRKMAYCENPEPILAVFEQRAWTLAEVFSPSPGGEGKEHTPAAKQPANPGLWLVAVGMEKPGNLGAMARSIEAVGGAGLLVADGVVDPFNPNAIRASTGAVFSLPIVGGTSGEVIAALRREKIRIFAAAVGADTPYTAADLAGPAALVIGAEDKGLPEIWLAAARQSGAAISIPMRGRVVDSLNASVSAAILLFEALRQREGSSKARPA